MPNELDYDQTQDYLTGLVPPRPVELQAMEAYAEQTTFPIVGPAAGYACYQIARMIGARRICELGSGYGYSTAWFAHAVHENLAMSGADAGGGVVHHVVWDEELSQRAQQHLGRLGFAHIVQYHIGEAVQVLRELAGPFDLIFNDVNKDGYPDSAAGHRRETAAGRRLDRRQHAVAWAHLRPARPERCHPRRARADPSSCGQPGLDLERPSDPRWAGSSLQKMMRSLGWIGAPIGRDSVTFS